MAAEPVINDLQLAALLCSRVCHDLISPVGAISNGLEVYQDEKDKSMREAALDLMSTSTAQASAKLKFARLVFGAAGSISATLEIDEARKAIEEFLTGGNVTFGWQAPEMSVDKDFVKLVMNLALIAIEALPRGGDIQITVGGTAPQLRADVHAVGSKVRVPAGVAEALSGDITAEQLDARSVQPYYASRLAAQLGLEASMDLSDDALTLAAA